MCLIRLGYKFAKWREGNKLINFLPFIGLFYLYLLPKFFNLNII